VKATAGSIVHVEFSFFYFFVSLCERTLNVRGFPVREEGQVKLLGHTPNGLDATAEFQLRPKVSRTEFPAILCRGRDARRQCRSCARWNPLLRPSRNSNPLAEIVSDDFPILHAVLPGISICLLGSGSV